MRHALIRLARKLNLDIKCNSFLVKKNIHIYKNKGFVAKPDPEVFEITKKKFHNVLQGVSDLKLLNADQSCWTTWVQKNVFRYWAGNQKGPLVSANVVVIDDPQCKFVITEVN